MKFYSCSIALILLLSFSQTGLSQEMEAVDIEGLRSQLETSNAQVHKTDSPNTHLQNQKESLEKEEEALMKKLENNKAENNEKELPLDESKIEKELALESSLSPLSKEDELPVKSEEKENNVAKTEIKPVEAENKVEQKAVAIEKNDSAKLSKLEKTNADLRAQQASLKARLEEKNKELEETRNRLVIAETQVERLSGILEKINNQKLAGYLGSADAKNVSAKSGNTTYQAKNSATYVNPVSATKNKDEAMVGVVTAQKAYLRSGPSKDDSPIMSVSKGTRLVVETRNNEWYRVITPTGGRAWISTQMLSFGPGSNPGSSSALRIGGYEATPK